MELLTRDIIVQFPYDCFHCAVDYKFEKWAIVAMQGKKKLLCQKHWCNMAPNVGNHPMLRRLTIVETLAETIISFLKRTAGLPAYIFNEFMQERLMLKHADIVDDKIKVQLYWTLP